MTETRRSSDTLRADHAELAKRIAALQETLDALAKASPLDARTGMERTVVFLDEEIRPHAAWEEVRLYPVVDRAVGGASPFTAGLREAHDAMDRWIDELAVVAARPEPDAAAFARLATRVFATLAAHFEEEERVLLPVLDRAFTPDELSREVGADPASAHME